MFVVFIKNWTDSIEKKSTVHNSIILTPLGRPKIFWFHKGLLIHSQNVLTDCVANYLINKPILPVAFLTFAEAKVVAPPILPRTVSTYKC